MTPEQRNELVREASLIAFAATMNDPARIEKARVLASVSTDSVWDIITFDAVGLATALVDRLTKVEVAYDTEAP